VLVPVLATFHKWVLGLAGASFGPAGISAGGAGRVVKLAGCEMGGENA